MAAAIDPSTATARRRLILRDSVALLTLLSITLALFAATLLLFRSFQAQRAKLAGQWAASGALAFGGKEPQQAVVAYRTALAYAPGERAYELRLAQALGAAGHTEEAYSYFLGLWEMRPGDGFINLQLARLAATRHDSGAAIDFYRAAIYGTWEGDGVTRRREVRLELARYLLAQHQASPARAELLIAGGNAPDTPEIALTLAPLLEQAGAPSDALLYYRKALAADPKNARALRAAGRLASASGDYRMAHTLLERAARSSSSQEDMSLLSRTDRILQLQPSSTLPAPERVERILTARTIARKRLTVCAAADEALRPLVARWTQEGAATRSFLLRNSDRQAATLQLVYDTEIATSRHCGEPAGDDALLLVLARQAQAQEVRDR